jgi:hypothetical protein
MRGSLTIEDAVSTIRKGDPDHPAREVCLEFIGVEGIQCHLDTTQALFGTVREFLVFGVCHASGR